ncbi:MAG: S1/P1 nuclease [Verrucomicrobiota bacterium]
MAAHKPRPWMAIALSALLLGCSLESALAWNDYGHMAVAYVAYQRLTPAVRQRATELIQLNPNYSLWSSWVPTQTSKAKKDRLIFMFASLWADEIKSQPGYQSDGSHSGNRPDGSPNPTANDGYSDVLRHKYWHFVDVPFAVDGTLLPAVPTPHAEERIGLFRRVLASNQPDPLKSYDLVWLLHLVGDVHQPLHCVTRVSGGHPEGDDGGNGVKLQNSSASNLHSFWDGVAGDVASPKSGAARVISDSGHLPQPGPVSIARMDEHDWVEESSSEAQAVVYQPPVMPGDGPFVLDSAYKTAAKRLARARITLAGIRLAKLLNAELR